MAKFIFRVLSGTSEIERICAGDPRLTPSKSSSLTSLDAQGGNTASNNVFHSLKRRLGPRDEVATFSSAMAEALWVSLSRTSKLSCFRDKMLLEDADPVTIADEILGAKKFNSDKEQLRLNLIKCVQAVVRYSAVLTRVRALQKTNFSADTPEHEKMLERLWLALLPDTPRKGGRITTEWGKIGFQGKDPATDFRGGGYLGLSQLLYFAETRGEAARAMLQDQRVVEVAKYPFSCCGINITAELSRILEGRALLGPTIYDADSVDDAMEALNGVYSDFFEFFHEEYARNSPADVMAFPPAFKDVIAKVEAGLAKNGRVPAPGSATSSSKHD